MTGSVYPPSFRRVVCAVDFSQHSRAALYLAAGLTFARGCRLIVLLVDDRAVEDDRAREAAQVELQEFVRTTLPGSPGYREGLECLVKGGDAADVILATAEDHHADALVVGSRGRSAVSRAIFGSTSTALMRRTRTPLFIVPPSEPELLSLSNTRVVPHLGIILVPLDLEQPSSRQIEIAATLSPGSEHRLLLMHVATSGQDEEPAFAQLNAAAASHPTARGCRVLVKSGVPVDAVLSILRHEHVGVVVLGQSGHAPGKIAGEIVRYGRSVVVVVPA